jgi:hypothetical protein
LINTYSRSLEQKKCVFSMITQPLPNPTFATFLFCK